MATTMFDLPAGTRIRVAAGAASVTVGNRALRVEGEHEFAATLTDQFATRDGVRLRRGVDVTPPTATEGVWLPDFDCSALTDDERTGNRGRD